MVEWRLLSLQLWFFFCLAEDQRVSMVNDWELWSVSDLSRCEWNTVENICCCPSVQKSFVAVRSGLKKKHSLETNDVSSHREKVITTISLVNEKLRAFHIVTNIIKVNGIVAVFCENCCLRVKKYRVMHWKYVLRWVQGRFYVSRTTAIGSPASSQLIRDCLQTQYLRAVPKGEKDAHTYTHVRTEGQRKEEKKR